MRRVYRDLLIEAILSEPSLGNEAAYRVTHFANLISDAISEAGSDRLKKTIRRQRAERVSDELRMAKRSQQHLLPKTLPRIPGLISWSAVSGRRGGR